MLVRLAFSIATSVDPDILIIDEALSVGDGAFRRRSFDRIMHIKERGTTILFCSHVLYHIETFCDRALWLHRGKVQKVGKVSEVLPPYQDFIDAYERDVNTEPQAALPQTPSVQVRPLVSAASYPVGSARINAVTIRLDGQEGAELHGKSMTSRLEAEIDFSSDPRPPHPLSRSRPVHRERKNPRFLPVAYAGGGFPPFGNRCRRCADHHRPHSPQQGPISGRCLPVLRARAAWVRYGRSSSVYSAIAWWPRTGSLSAEWHMAR